MSLIRRDFNEGRLYAIFLLSRSEPNYFRDLFKNAKALFWGMGREDLIVELDELIEDLIEKPMGSDINTILAVHKNLPTINSFTRSKNPLRMGENVYKHTITIWLQEVETFIFRSAISLESSIRFTATARQWI